MKKLTLEFIEKEFKKENYILLTEKYIDNTQKLSYICPNGHKHSIPWRSWKNGSRCYYCNEENKKLNIKFIQKKFEKEGYKLLATQYRNCEQKLDYICPKGHKHSISWNKFKAGSRCFYCYGTIKKTIEFIEKSFEKENYTLLSTEYKNAFSKLSYICPEGHKNKTNWHRWQQGQRCPQCAGKAKYRIEDIRKEFEKEGYILLTDVYKNAFGKLRYKCNRAHVGFMTWHSWKNSGSRCSKCKHENMLADGNPNWKGGISCEPYCQDWTKEYKEYIKERDGYKCLNPDCVCNFKRLSIHHIDYVKKNCDSSNLITLCTPCNSRANKDREWHKGWYQAILSNRYGYKYEFSKIVGR